MRRRKEWKWRSWDQESRMLTCTVLNNTYREAWPRKPYITAHPGILWQLQKSQKSTTIVITREQLRARSSELGARIYSRWHSFNIQNRDIAPRVAVTGWLHSMHATCYMPLIVSNLSPSNSRFWKQQRASIHIFRGIHRKHQQWFAEICLFFDEATFLLQYLTTFTN